MNTNGDLYQSSDFPQKPEPQPAHKKLNCKIYVSPFQFRPIEPWVKDDSQNKHTNSPKKPRKESVFAHIAGKDHFDNPAIVAIIRFKWYKFVIKYWFMRFILVLVFFILMMAITAKQIAVSSREPDEVPTPDKIAARYLPEWRPTFKVAI
ncbi:hypothetical protein BGZ65_000152, partial [Modicella reniformis]